MEHRDLLKRLETEMKAAADKMFEADKNEQSCLAKGDFNTAAYWTQESKLAWQECEHIRERMWKLTNNGDEL